MLKASARLSGIKRVFAVVAPVNEREEERDKIVNVPAAGVVPPITALSIVPPKIEDPLIVSTPLLLEGRFLR